MSVLLEAPPMRAPADSTRTADGGSIGARLLGVLPVASVLVADPAGLAPFGPAKWLAVSSIAAAGVGAVLLRTSSGRADRQTSRWWLALLASLTLGAVFGGDVPTAILGHPVRHLGLLTWVLFAAAFVAAQRVHDPGQRRLVVRGFAGAAVVLGAWSSWELAVGRVIAIDVTTERATGPFGSAVVVGASACLLGPVAWGLAVDTGEQRRWRIVGGLGGATSTVALAASGARGAWFAAVAVAIIVATRVRPARRVVMSAGAITLVAIAIVAPRLDDLVERSAGATSRIDEWRVATRVLAEHPIVGVGPEGYRFAVADGIDRGYERTYGRAAVLPDRAHSGPLDVAVSGGLPAALSFLVLLGLVGRRCWRLLRVGAPPAHVGLAAGVIAYGLQQLVLFPLAEVDVLWWLAAGLVVATRPVDGAEPAPPTATRLHRSPASRIGGAVAIAITPVLLVAGLLDVAADRMARRAVASLADGGIDDAILDAERAVDLRPDDVRYRLVAAYVLGEVGTIEDIRRGIEHADAARAWSDDDPHVADRHASLLLQLAQVTADDGDVGDSLAAWVELVGRDPHRARWQLQLGRAAVLAGEDALARAAWTSAADLAPDDGTAQRLLDALAERTP
jgi:O-antigen ligase